MDFIQAFIGFLTDLFAALSEFLGKSFPFAEIIGEITETEAPAEEL